MVEITNVQMSCSIGARLDLREMCMLLTNVVYNPKRMNCLVIENRRFCGKSLLFASGHMCVHGKSVQICKHKMRSFARLVSNKGKLNIRHLINTKIVTISLSHCLACSCVKLTELYVKMQEHPNIRYLSLEPELFPGLIVSYKNSKCTFSCTFFRSGKVIITGVKKEWMIESYLYPFLLDVELMT